MGPGIAVLVLVSIVRVSLPAAWEDEKTHRLTDLQKTADRLAVVLRSKDVDGFIDLLRPNSLTIGIDRVVRRPALDEELRQRKGETYELLFGDRCGIRAVLMKRTDIETSIGLSYDFRLNEATGRIERAREKLNTGSIVYHWAGAPADEGMMDFPGFGMVYSEGRWLVGELFH